MRLLPLAAVFAAALACGPESFELAPWSGELAEDDEAARVELWFEDGEARLRVTLALHNHDDAPAHLSREVRLPEGGVADGLRIEGPGGWRQAALFDEDAALGEYLGEEGDFASEPAPAALLESIFGDGLTLQIGPLRPGQRVRVQYDVRAPLQYEEGDWQFTLEGPATLLPFGPRVLSVEEVPREDGEVDGPPQRRYRLGRPDFGVLQLRWATLGIGPSRSAWRLELETAKALMPLPDRARFVFAIDASRSVGEDGLGAQLALLPHILAHAPGAEVELVVFRRRAERLFGRFVPAAQLADALARVPPERLRLGNGSHLDEAARLAGDLLREAPGEARAVLFTDASLRAAFDPALAATLLERLPAGAFAHLVAIVPEAQPLGLERDFEHRLAPLAHAGGGVFFHARGEVTQAEDAAQLEVLVRPTRIEQVQLEVDGMEQDRFGVPDVLSPGEAFIDMGLADGGGPRRMRAKGWLWGRRLELSPAADGRLEAQLPARLIADPHAPYLGDDELAVVAHQAGAVSRVTSLVVAPLGRPEQELGFGRAGGRGISFGSRCGGAQGWGTGGLMGFGVALPPLPPLHEAVLGACARRQGIDPEAAFVFGVVEVAGDEILDVRIDSATTPALADCVSEGLWALWLPEGTRDGHHPLDAPPATVE